MLIKYLNMNKIKVGIRPKLNNCRLDPSKRWFVYYSYRNPDTGKMVRFKVHAGFDKIQSVQDKLKHAEIIIQQINRRLDVGFNPFHDTQKFMYENMIEHHQALEKLAEFLNVPISNLYKAF